MADETGRTFLNLLTGSITLGSSRVKTSSESKWLRETNEQKRLHTVYIPRRQLKRQHVHKYVLHAAMPDYIDTDMPSVANIQLLRIVREVHPSTSNVVRSTEPIRSHQCIFELQSLQFTSEPEEPTSSTESSSHFSDDSYIDDQFFSEFMFRLLQQYPGQRIHPVEIIFPWTENPKQVRLPRVSVQEMLNLVIEVCPTTRRSIPGLSPGDLLRPIIDHSLYRFRNTGPVGGTD